MKILQIRRLKIVLQKFTFYAFFSKDAMAPQLDLLWLGSQRDEFDEKSGYQIYQLGQVEILRLFEKKKFN